MTVQLLDDAEIARLHRLIDIANTATQMDREESYELGRLLHKLDNDWDELPLFTDLECEPCQHAWVAFDVLAQQADAENMKSWYHGRDDQ